MKSLCAAFLVAATAGSVPAAALAESLRCVAGIASEGDSRISLLYKCGPPLLVDSYCAPAYYGGTFNLAPYYVGIPCQQMEDLVYERGEGNLVATVSVRWGVIQSITYGRTPR